MTACFFGGIVVRGGHSHRTDIVPAASLTRGANYQIVCTVSQIDAMPADLQTQTRQAIFKKVQASKKITENVETTNQNTSAAELAHVRLILRDAYQGGCERDGQTSVFFLLNLFPLTDPLDTERAIALAVQSVEGDSMVNLRVWHEIHYYGLIGRVAVWHVRGDVIRYETK